MKNWRFILSAILFILILSSAGCGSPGIPAGNNQSRMTFTRENWAELDTSPNKFKGAFVDIGGKVFTAPQKDKDGIYFQMWVDPKDNEYNTVVAVKDSSLDIKSGDYVNVTGIVTGKFSGKNAMGGEIAAPMILADSAIKINPKEILAPTKLKVDVNQSRDQYGLAISLTRIHN
ncbi:MAG: hypothetical protein M1489_01900, partial [Firmicutes bacterium]|nr:hypothetical protein [Bacillota bacterium]